MMLPRPSGRPSPAGLICDMARAAEQPVEYPEGPWATASLHGHAEAEALLLRAWQSDRMPHAMMITGPRGIGKATLAYRFARFVQAQALEEENSLFGEPAPADSLFMAEDDPVFRQVAQGGHPGIVTVAPSVNPKTKKQRQDIVVDDVRSMQSMYAMTAEGGAWRIAIVDAADEMTRQAANALLKILEEPPEKSLLLLIAHSPGQVLNTIRSRCQEVRLRPLNATDLSTVLAEHDIEVPEGRARDIALLSEGRPGHALMLMEADGLGLHDSILDILERATRPDMNAIHNLGDQLARSGSERRFALFCELLEGILLRLVRSLGGQDESAGICAAEKPIFAAMMQETPLEQWMEVWENTRQLFARTEAVNLDKKQAVLLAFNDVLKRMK